MQRLRPLLLAGHRHAVPLRSMGTVSSILSSARASAPQKDAIKFVRLPSTTSSTSTSTSTSISTSDTKSFIWTYTELSTHVDALTAGLRGLRDLHRGDVVVTCLPTHSSEHVVLLLTAARLGLHLVTCPSVSDVTATVQKHEARALFVPSAPGDSDVVRKSHAVVSVLDPGISMGDCATLPDALTASTGRALRSAALPHLRYVVHTGADNVRGTLAFRSLLVYSGETTNEKEKDVVEGGAQQWIGSCTQGDVVQKAMDFAKAHQLSNDHAAKAGNVVVKPGTTEDKAVAAGVAAISKQALWICPHPDVADQVTADHDAVVA